MDETLLKTIADLNAAYGRAVVRNASDLPCVRRVRCKVPMIDYVSGGGIPINRITELYGPYSSGKSYIALLTIAEFQKYDFANDLSRGITKINYKERKIVSSSKEHGKIEHTLKVIESVKGVKPNAVAKRAVLVDYENTYDKKWGEKLGIDNEGLLHFVPDRGSELVDQVEALLSDPDIGLIVVDSIAAASSDLELDASMEDEQMGVNARFWNKAMRKWQSAMNSNPEQNITVIVINRPYAKLGMVFGNPEEVGSGSGLKFGKSVSIRLTPLKEISGKDEDGTEVTVGRNIRCKCVKNKTSRPFLEGDFYFSFVNDGRMKAGHVDTLGQIVTLAITKGIVKRSGAYYTYKKEKTQGREDFISWVEERGLANKMYDEVMDSLLEEV